MSKSKALILVLPESDTKKVEEVLQGFVDLEHIHRRSSLLYQAAQGACLLRLQQDYGFARGHHGSKTATCGFSSWADLVEKKYKFSDDKALRLMNRWRAVSPLIDKLSPKDKEKAVHFLKRPQLHMTPDEVKVLDRITTKITTLDEEVASLEDCKYIRQRHGASLKNRASTGGDDDAPPAHTVEDKIQEQLELFGKFALSVDEVTDEDGRKVHVITKWPTAQLDEAIAIAKKALATLVKVRNTRK